MKRIGLIAVLTILLASTGLLGFGIYQSISSRPEFYTGGYVLTGDTGQVKQLAFTAETSYVSGGEGAVQFKDVNGQRVEIAEQSFFYLDDGAIMALSGGVLFDFEDLSSNFINNYYISPTLPITANNGTYVAETTSGTMEFGENLWKLSDGRYLIQSPTLSVYFAEGDIREVAGFIQVSISDDGIVQLLSAENRWVTISEACYIETEGGVQIYPVTQLVDNGTYKMSMAKLSVSPDDSIVLTEDETRRQIVPELLIETIDGEDGDSGEDGEIGADGTSGQDGTDGIEGIDGESGAIGNTGTTGEAGEAGAEGDTGSSGKDGSNGGSGGSGSAGSDGSNGSSGGSGVNGNNAGDSSANSALPTVSITNWNVGFSSLSGTMMVNDSAECLVLNSEDYPTLVTIYNVATGEKIACYESTDADHTNFTCTGDSMHEMTWDFTTQNDPLEPDTQYELSVTAYYSFGDDASSTIYSRELLSRTFYTDSTGVILTYDSATTDSINLNVLLASGYEGTVKKATVVLLTPEQEVTFNANSNLKTATTQYFELTYGDTVQSAYTYTSKANGELTTVTNPSKSTTPSNVAISFGEIPEKTDDTTAHLDSNSHYVVRVIVEAFNGTSSITKLSSQALPVATLKAPPTWAPNVNDDTSVTAIYNRVTGLFEVHPALVIDDDKGIQDYTITVYDDSGNVVSSKTVLPERLDSATFSLSANTYYTFGVTFTFDDNEKTITYDMGQSLPIMSVGDEMPTLTLLEKSSSNTEWTGTLTVNVGDNTRAKFDTYNPWTLDIYSDLVWEQGIELSVANQNYNDSLRYSITGSINSDSNNVVFELDFDNLLSNKTYTINVTGAVDVGDGSNDANATAYSQLSLGGISFYTRTNSKTIATYSNVAEDGSFARTLQIGLVEGDPDKGEIKLTDAQAAAELAALQSGQVILDLYSGTGNNKTFMESEVITSDDDLADIYGEGLSVDKSMFSTMGSVSTGSSATSYTLVVSSLADKTYEYEASLGYVNTYDVPLNNTSVVTVLPGPPELSTAPEDGVAAVPIYNKDSATYGKLVDTTLSDDTVVGYKLQATYDNGQRVGETVTYYAFEANALYNMVKMADPIANSGYLVSYTHDINSDSDTVPAVAIFFGDAPSTYKEGDFQNNAYVHYAGEAQVDEASGAKLNSGMGRGFKYVFAYTATYTIGESEAKQYPNDVSTEGKSYNDYKNTYGMGYPFSTSTTRVGVTTVYMLNSGVVEAPKATPTVYNFVEKTTPSILEVTGGQYTAGSVTVNFTLDDPDGAVTDKTSVSYQVKSSSSDTNTFTKIIKSNNILGFENWYSLDFEYNIYTQGNSFEIKPEILADWYQFDYDANMKDWGWIDVNAEATYLCQVPVEWAWGAYFEYLRGKDADTQDSLVTLSVETKEEENYMQFTVNPTVSGSTYLTNLYSRAAGMVVTLTPEDSTLAPYTTLLSLSSDTNVSSQQYIAKLSLSSIPNVASYINTPLSVSASIYYEDGNQGWGLITDTDDSNATIPGRFAIQYKALNENSKTIEFGQYYTGLYNSTSSYTSNAMLKQYVDATSSTYPTELVTLDDLRSAVSKGTSVKLAVQNQSSTSYIRSAYLMPSALGMDFSFSSSTGYYAVPKGISTHTFEKTPTTTIELLMPTASQPSYIPSKDGIDITGITINNSTYLPTSAGVDGCNIYLALYDNEVSAKTLAPDDSLLDTQTVVVSKDGSVTYKSDALSTDNYIPYGTLELGTNYYLSFYYVDEDTSEKVHLLQNNSSNVATYTVSTLGEIVIASDQKLQYHNYSYFQKYMEINYSVSRISDVTVKYEIFNHYPNSDSDTDTVLDQEDFYKLMNLTGYDANYQLPANDTTGIKVDLSPSTDRSVFKPGETYYLRITAYEDGEFATSSCYDVTIDPAKKATTTIKASNVTGSTMTFTVTVSDTSESYMASKFTETNDGYGQYAVRFFTQPEGSTNSDITTWNEIQPLNADSGGGTENYSTFDTALTYSMNSAQQTFNLRDLDPTTIYAIKVYGVYDESHTNQSPLMYTGTGTETATYTYDALFDTYPNSSATEADPKASYPFTSYVGKYMTKDTTLTDAADITANEARIAQEDAKFCLGSSTQATATESGILIDTNYISLKRKDATALQLYLSNSYGLIQNGANTITRVEMDITQVTTAGTKIYTINDKNPTFTEGTNYGMDAYIYTIDETLSEGFYQVVLSLYSTNTSGSEQAEVKSFAVKFDG